MITGFETITAELTPEEKKLVPQFVNGLKTKIGKKSAVTNKHIRARFKTIGVTVSDARVRKIVNFIRISDLVPMLCSTSKGYFVAQSVDEVESYLKGLKERIAAQQAVHDAIERQFNNVKQRNDQRN
jgi:hypothetical protein